MLGLRTLILSVQTQDRAALPVPILKLLASSITGKELVRGHHSLHPAWTLNGDHFIGHFVFDGVITNAFIDHSVGVKWIYCWSIFIMSCVYLQNEPNFFCLILRWNFVIRDYCEGKLGRLYFFKTFLSQLSNSPKSSKRHTYRSQSRLLKWNYLVVYIAVLLFLCLQWFAHSLIWVLLRVAMTADNTLQQWTKLRSIHVCIINVKLFDVDVCFWIKPLAPVDAIMSGF